MRKIINGRKYDTETATLVCEAENRFGKTDFQYVHEWLYRKRTGEYFIYGEGGPMSRYARHAYGSDGRTSSEAFRPITEAEAREWAEGRMGVTYFLAKDGMWRHGCMKVDEYEAEFGEVEE